MIGGVEVTQEVMRVDKSSASGWSMLLCIIESYWSGMGKAVRDQANDMCLV